MAFLELKNICKSYGSAGKRVDVLHNINLSVEEGEFLAILGFSGSGKSTLISLISGLAKPDKGEVSLRGVAVAGPGPDRGVVFQNYSLLPWLTVRANVALAVDNVFRSWTHEERDAQVDRYIEMVNLTAAANNRPAELSGGMRQRVSVARTLAINPDILLLDEPLSALDALTRATLQSEIERICSHEKKTVILITNDIDEAILLADRIVPLNPGLGATLGPDFHVGLPRPRDKKALNNNPEYKRLRNGITNHLLEIRRRQREGQAGGKVSEMDMEFAAKGASQYA